jgi:hypothetical protein
MRMSNISAGVWGVFILALFPFAAEAYFTTGQTATKLSPNVALFTIEYAFGLKDHDMYMPIIAERNLLRESSEKKVGYVFTDNGKNKEEGTSVALVLSSAPIEKGMYKIAKGAAQKMTLLAFLSVDERVTEEDFALHVQKLPYYVDKGGKALEALQLNPSELQYYLTNEIELNTRKN